MKEYYVDCNLYFRDVMEINEEINYNIKNNPFIEIVTISPIKDEKDEAFMKIFLSYKKCKEFSETKIYKLVEEFILEFLLKLSLNNSIFFPFYKIKYLSVGDKKIIYDTISCTDTLQVIHSLNEKFFPDEDINFIKHKEKYVKLIRILSLIESDPVIVFMTLYDWFLEWVTPSNEKKKQINIKKYILDNFNLLDLKKFCSLINKNDWFIKSHNKEEDIFTYLRNDIGHSYERIENNNISSLSSRAKNLIIPLVYVMKTYLKNS